MSTQKSFTLIPYKVGPEDVIDETFPLRYGTYSEIFTDEHRFMFNLNGEVKAVSGTRPSWPHPGEQLKRTDGNDWIYYTVGDDSSDRGGIRSWLGEYYLPCLSYPSNPIWLVDFYAKPMVMKAYAAWYNLYSDLATLDLQDLRADQKEFVQRVIANNDNALMKRADLLHEIIGGRVSVLPPDTRHVDYELIPLNIADGCLYRCKFCCVKSDNGFKARPKEQVLEQINRLKEYYGDNLINYKAVFLGNHDALAAGAEHFLFAARTAYDEFGFASRKTPPSLFSFASVGSLLKADDAFFDELNSLRYKTYFNVGLESADQGTLEMLGKPITPMQVRKAFNRILELNRRYENVEISANFVIGDSLSPAHVHYLKELLQSTLISDTRKTILYLSPLQNSPRKKELLPLIRDIQNCSKFTVLVYLIQRL